jgi:hypothetical protein
MNSRKRVVVSLRIRSTRRRALASVDQPRTTHGLVALFLVLRSWMSQIRTYTHEITGVPAERGSKPSPRGDASHTTPVPLAEVNHDLFWTPAAIVIAVERPFDLRKHWSNTNYEQSHPAASKAVVASGSPWFESHTFREERSDQGIGAPM